MTTLLIDAQNVSKTFVLHQQDGLALPVLDDVSLQVAAGECVALVGPSGAGKSTFLKALYANYLVQAGTIGIFHREHWVDMAQAQPHQIVEVRRHTLGYVSQFLRVIPRVSALDIVAEPLVEWGESLDAARVVAGEWLTRLNISERLWSLPPATFSGGEQQRVNIARGMIAPRPILLLDEPTASLDAANRAVVIELMREAKARGAALVGIFHDEATRDTVADRLFTVPLARRLDTAKELTA
jgi:alpha-D-ribose 1-methylphosphonate 5-triphosphate synthase subunit PhnL